MLFGSGSSIGTLRGGNGRDVCRGGRVGVIGCIYWFLVCAAEMLGAICKGEGLRVCSVETSYSVELHLSVELVSVGLMILVSKGLGARPFE